MVLHWLKENCKVLLQKESKIFSKKDFNEQKYLSTKDHPADIGRTCYTISELPLVIPN